MSADRGPLSPKQRAALCRRRRARGLVSLTLDVPQVPLSELLIASNYLAESDEGDLAALRAATEEWIEDQTAPAAYETVTALRRAILRIDKL